MVFQGMRSFSGPRSGRLYRMNPSSILAGSTTSRQKAAFWRGGTSNGIMISGSTLPQWQKIKSHYPDGKINLKDCAKILEPLYRAIMGSPDPYGRQLNGMGGGLSSLSKAVIVDKSMSKDYDLDYLFIQIGSESTFPTGTQHTCDVETSEAP